MRHYLTLPMPMSLQSFPAQYLQFSCRISAMAIQHCYYTSSTLMQPHPDPQLNRIQTKRPLYRLSKPSQNPIKTCSLKDICKNGSLKEAFRSFDASFVDGTNPDEIYAPLLELSAAHGALLEGQQIHAYMIKSSVVPASVFLSTKLVFMYGKCGSLLDAENMFDGMFERTVFTWNAMMGAYVSNGEPLGALKLYRDMRILGITVDSCTFPCVLKACGAVEDLRCGAEIHGLVVKCGYDAVVFVANSLVAMYAKCNDISIAGKLFDRMSERNDAVSWNSIISAYSANGQCMKALGLFREMQKFGLAASTYTFVAVLQACENSSFRKLGMEIHAVILKLSKHPDVYVANALLAMYVRYGRVGEAAVLFGMLDVKDTVTWNSMLTGFIQNGLYNEALQYFHNLQDAGLRPDKVSIISMIAASARLGYLLNGKEIHGYAIKNGLDTDLRVGNTLIDMYSKCCCMNYAARTFDKMLDKDCISWTTVMAGYAQNNYLSETLELLKQVQMEGMDADVMMIGSVLLACSGLKCFLGVKEVHGYIMRQGLSDLMLHNSIVDAYGECGNINYATSMFESIEHKDVVSWTSMISSYVHNGLANEALEVFHSMKETGVEPDAITLVSILSAAASLSALKKGKEIHGFLIRRGFVLEGSLANSLVDMYACCGNLENAYKMFVCTKNKCVVLWTTMINACGMHGQGETAVDLFTRMQDQELIPDHITFLALLYACSHSGLIEDGKRFLEIMKHKYQLEPWPEHFACLVDLLGRANLLEEAYQFVKSMPIEPTAEIWCALLRACQVHSNKEIGEIAIEKLLELDPHNPGNFVLVSNAFAASGRWEDAEKVRIKMKATGLKKTPGCSWTEIGNKVHSFIARHKSHPVSHKIYKKLAQITKKLEREGGYVAQTKFVLHNVEEEDKVQMLYGHSERLAIAYCLLNTPDGTPIRITKNLRVCHDCHTFCRLVSKLFETKLIVRDASRFHHFEGGVCSCGEFW